jgi:hypothetical protein
MTKDVSIVPQFVQFICGETQSLENVKTVPLDAHSVPVLILANLHVMQDSVSLVIYVNLLISNAHPALLKSNLILPVVSTVLMNAFNAQMAHSAITKTTFVVPIVMDISSTNNV